MISRVLLAALLFAWSTRALAAQPVESNEPTESTASDLREFWLRFHETELCQGLDAVFAFQPKGMEIWCVIEDEKDFERLIEMLEPLRARYQIGVYPTRPQPEKKSLQERNDPPPSLWNNEELRNYFQDPFTRGLNASGAGLGARPPSSSGSDTDFFLKQRMILFSDETLDWDKRMGRYAAELPALTRLALESSLSPETRARAASVCLTHAQAVDKFAGRLTDNLTRALPKATRHSKTAPGPDESSADSPPVEGAIQLSNSAQGIARRIYRFIHPQLYTVGLVDLKEPSLLEALRTLRKMTAAFERAIGIKP